MSQSSPRAPAQAGYTGPVYLCYAKHFVPKGAVLGEYTGLVRRTASDDYTLRPLHTDALL